MWNIKETLKNPKRLLVLGTLAVALLGVGAIFHTAHDEGSIPPGECGRTSINGIPIDELLSDQRNLALIAALFEVHNTQPNERDAFITELRTGCMVAENGGSVASTLSGYVNTQEAMQFLEQP